MAENLRVRVKPDIEAYLKSQSLRVLGKSDELLAGADLSTLVNRLLYEHKQVFQYGKLVPFGKLLTRSEDDSKQLEGSEGSR